MNRKAMGLIVGSVLVMLVVAGIFTIPRTRGQQPPEIRNAPQTARAQPPFRTAVVELTFRGRSLNQGEEYLTETGRRIEYIDDLTRRRREDLERDVTTLAQHASTDRFTLIFDGRRLYTVRNEGSNGVALVTDLGEGFDSPVWLDAPIEELNLPGIKIEQDEVLGRPCQVYTLSTTTGLQKYSVWNGLTLRSERHLGPASDVNESWEEAVRVEENTAIDPGLFVPPADVTFQLVTETPTEQEAIARLLHGRDLAQKSPSKAELVAAARAQLGKR
jgi:hypothetical protein